MGTKNFTNFDDFAEALSRANKITGAKFAPKTKIDLTRLATLIASGHCKSLELLDLKGVEFINAPSDKSAFSVLEDVFKKINTHKPRLLPNTFVLNVANTNLKAKDVKVLMELVPRIDTLGLDLRHNDLGDQGAAHVAEALRALKDRESHRLTINLENNQLTSVGFDCIFDAITSRGTSYVDLHKRWHLLLGNTELSQPEVGKEKAKSDDNQYDALLIQSKFGEYIFNPRIELFTTDQQGVPPVITLRNTLFGAWIAHFAKTGSRTGPPSSPSKAGARAISGEGMGRVLAAGESAAPQLEVVAADEPLQLDLPKVVVKPPQPVMITHGAVCLTQLEGASLNTSISDRELRPSRLDGYSSQLYGHYAHKDFRHPVSYELCLWQDQEPEKGKLYLSMHDGRIAYRVITPAGSSVAVVTNIKAPEPFELSALNALKSDILAVASANAHINQLQPPPLARSNDAVYKGYTIQGLPYQVMVTFSGNLAEPMQELMFKFAGHFFGAFISEYVRTLSRTDVSLHPIITNSVMEKILKLRNFNLSERESPDNQILVEELMEKLLGIHIAVASADEIRQAKTLIYDFIEQVLQRNEFGLSLAVTYQKTNSDIRCAGFGIGGQAGVAFKSGAKVGQLVHTTSDVKVETNVFDVSVERRDEVFAYTGIAEDKLLVKSPKGFALQVTGFRENDSLYTQVKEINSGTRNLSESSTKGHKQIYHDHFMLSSMKIPTEEYQHFLQEHMKLTVMIEALEQDLLDHDNDYDEELKQKKRQLLTYAKQLLDDIVAIREDKRDIKLSALIFCLRRVNIAMQDPSEDNIKLLKVDADQAQGSPIPALRNLGISMMSIGATLASIGAAMMIYFPPLFFIGLALTIAGGALLAAGAISFFVGRHRGGLSQSMVDIAEVPIDAHSMLNLQP